MEQYQLHYFPRNLMMFAATYNSNSEKADAFAKEHGIDVFQWNVADANACEAGVKSY